MLSAIMEDYLKAIYFLQQDADGRVKTSAIAEYMSVEPSTVTSMMNKLSEQGLVHYEPYKGVELTDTGTPIALEVIRHHRLLEQYLSEHLEYDWSEVHDEADQLEHYISDRFAERVAAVLDDPNVDPHGDPIPTPDLELASPPVTETLEDQNEGDSVEIVRVNDRDRTVLEYLSDHGIRPGITATVVEIAPYGMILLLPERADEPVGIPAEIAQSVFVHSPPTDGD